MFPRSRGQASHIRRRFLFTLSVRATGSHKDTPRLGPLAFPSKFVHAREINACIARHAGGTGRITFPCRIRPPFFTFRFVRGAINYFSRCPRLFLPSSRLTLLLARSGTHWKRNDAFRRSIEPSRSFEFHLRGETQRNRRCRRFQQLCLVAGPPKCYVLATHWRSSRMGS